MLLNIRDLKTEDWIKSPQGRSKMRLFCCHFVEPDFTLMYYKSYCAALFCSMITIVHERELPCPYRKARLLDYTAW